MSEQFDFFLVQKWFRPFANDNTGVVLFESVTVETHLALTKRWVFIDKGNNYIEKTSWRRQMMECREKKTWSVWFLRNKKIFYLLFAFILTNCNYMAQNMYFIVCHLPKHFLYTYWKQVDIIVQRDCANTTCIRHALFHLVLT